MTLSVGDVVRKVNRTNRETLIPYTDEAQVEFEVISPGTTTTEEDGSSSVSNVKLRVVK